MSLDIIMPVYNEEACIEGVVENIYDEILSKIEDSRLLAVNDGSKDRTGELLDNMAQKYSQVIVLHKKNGGHGDALLHGLLECSSKWIFLMDSDNQIDIKDFWKLWDKKEDYDILTGIRKVRHDPLTRLILTRIVRWSIFFLFQVYIQDGNVPFKLLRREVWEECEHLIPGESLAPSLFLILAAKKRLFRHYAASVTHFKRETGVCSIKHFKLLKFCFKAFLQMIRFRINLMLQ